jgi:hypothetical protein
MNQDKTKYVEAVERPTTQPHIIIVSRHIEVVKEFIYRYYHDVQYQHQQRNKGQNSHGQQMLLWSKTTIQVPPLYTQNQMWTVQSFVEASMDLWI